jgi:hypothetical protein
MPDPASAADMTLLTGSRRARNRNVGWSTRQKHRFG